MLQSHKLNQNITRVGESFPDSCYDDVKLLLTDIRKSLLLLEFKLGFFLSSTLLLAVAGIKFRIFDPVGTRSNAEELPFV